MNAEQMKILEMIANRIITAEEGEALLSSMGHAAEAPIEEPVVASGTRWSPENLEIESGSTSTKPAWSRFWAIPVASGAVMASLGSGYTVLAVIGLISRWWMFLTLPGMILGLLIFLFGWLMRTGPWLRIHVRDQEHNIHLSLPVPTYWLIELVSLARNFFPPLREWVSDDLLLMLVENSDEGLFNLEVEENSGEYVRISYG
jgi:hypothetical protein